MTAFTFLFFGALALSGIISIAKIHRQEQRDAVKAKRAHEARIKEFRARCFRPDGD